MDKLCIANLDQIVKLQYPHICIGSMDYVQFTYIPAQRKVFYPCVSKQSSYIGKRGFFNNGKTTVWSHFKIEPGYIKIAPGNRIPKNSDDPGSWSEVMSFQEEDSVYKIQKIMKLKAFW